MKRLLVVTLVLAFAASAVSGFWHASRPLPAGLDFAGPPQPVADVEFLADLTWLDATGAQQLEHQIFDAMLELVAAADDFLLVDMFLFNEFAGDADAGHRLLVAEFTEALLQRMAERPQLQVVFITDPFNTFYGSMPAPALQSLRDAGVQVVISDLDALPDSNPTWSGFWRLCCRWLPEPVPGRGWLPNPVADAPPVAMRSLLRVLNFKANHRKTLIAHTGEGWQGLVTSANIHDASSRHSNVALRFTGPAAVDLLATEQAILAFSAAPTTALLPATLQAAAGDQAPEPALPLEQPTLAVLSEAAIRDRALSLIDRAQEGDTVWLLMFYLAHEGVIRALADAAHRGVQVRVLLDPNRDAFGRRKDGVPNRQTALRLQRAGAEIRWCNTLGEQCHTKLLLREQGDRLDLLLGSANFTRRNLDNLNPETSVHLQGDARVAALSDARAFAQRSWYNEVDRSFSLPYEAWADESRLRLWRARFMEWSGLSSF